MKEIPPRKCDNCGNQFFPRTTRTWCSLLCGKELAIKKRTKYEEAYAKSRCITMEEARRKIAEDKKRYSLYSL